ncbi:glycine zipper 2TM domain-containing protein [Phenylobacterium sp.]|uniref:glycine zipper 2TM domain-containing protein n=1 Tax=Phenylobacterium sp. TaxID=1871053 RepID=UPI0025FE9A8A|nr:glycine zipper 2TM domain-containing protein [Phenylobacterium sp.]
MRNKLIATLVCSALAVTAVVPTAAQAERHRVRVCRDVSTRGARNTGTAVGAVGGGVVGNALGHGSVGGTVLGAVAGGVIGHQVAKHNATRKVCHWEWRG